MTSPPQSVVHGAPKRGRPGPYFTDAMHGMECGVWACEPGMWRIRFAANKLEFFVLEGHVRLPTLMVRCTTCAPGRPG